MSYPLHRSSKSIPASPNLPDLELEVLKFWDQDGTFQASIDQRPAGTDGDNEFVFYDGPPFANGLPHYGHLLTGYAKDVVPRFMTMRGKRVERRFGWDTHGLPAELEAERILGITDKSEIEAMGIEKFNATCRESVLQFTDQWQEYVTRQARWVDFENDYKTLDITFMESVIWAFKQLYDKGLAYEGFQVLPYCWEDETPLSNHELRMDDDVYQSRQDPALTVGVRLETGELALIWTTTPWTLPSNLAIAVGPDVDYVVLRPGENSELAGQEIILGAARMEAHAKELDLGDEPEAHVTRTIKGTDLAGIKYTPIFDFFAGDPENPNVHQILVADFVTTEDGTGLVHLAPAFGEDDMIVCEEAGISPVIPLDSRGRFTALVPEYDGQQVFDANPSIIRDLKDGSGPLARTEAAQRAVVVRHETYEHSYPHCWRCRNPLIYKAVSSWFVAVTKFRDRMVELNQEINWTPAHIKDGQFGKWLEGARDWSISRNRYWGTPIPVWVSDDENFPRTDVYGSLAELEADFGVEVTDLHRPFIDDLTRPNPDDPSGKTTMRRIPDVLDVWFDSGSMPFAQVHYPFENVDWFEHHFPGDFIVEYVGQTRGWFYLLHVLSTALFDRPAFRNAVSHGIVLGSDGRKMSKSLQNYPDVSEVLDRDGSDAMRWFLMSSPILRGGNLIVTEEGIRDSVRQVLLPVWSTYYFFTLYAGAANDGNGYEARRVRAEEAANLPVMDRYLLARTNRLVDRVEGQMDAFDIAGAAESVREHLDVMTNWYVRTQRDRFWDEDTDAFNTLWTALETLLRVMAPLAPLLTEEVWRGLTGGRSVHLTDWPSVVTDGATTTDGEVLLADEALVEAMDRVRAVASLSLGVRKTHQLRVRQPLAKLTVVLDDPASLEPYKALLRGELNVREVELLDLGSGAAEQFGISRQLTVNARVAGPRLGRGVQAVIRAAKAGDWHEDEADAIVVDTADGPVALDPHEFEVKTVVSDPGAGSPGSAEAGDRTNADGPQIGAAVLSGGGFVVLDLLLNDELRAEGYARDVVRDVQEARRGAGLDVSDRISLTLDIPADLVEAVTQFQELIARETLAVEVQINPASGSERTVQVTKTVHVTKKADAETQVIS